MGNKKIYITLLLISFIACIGVVGYYFYSTYFKNTDTSQEENTSEETSVNGTVLSGITNGSGGEKIPGCINGVNCYPQNLGGVDDYNGGGNFPSDGYYKVWTACDSINNYCGTGDSFAERKDPNTGLVWTGIIMGSSTWFMANNCKYPNGLLGDDGVCDTNGEVACVCVKNIGGESDPKSGCEAIGDGKWRLPYQKELMQAYIDGAITNLLKSNFGCWSATTKSDNTETAWFSYIKNGSTNNYLKSSAGYSIICVR